MPNRLIAKQLSKLKSAMKNTQQYPESPQEYAKLAMIAQKAKRDNEALDIWNEAVRRFPNSKRVHLGQARALRRQNRLDEAIKTLKSVINQWPDDSATRLFLGRLLLRQGESSPNEMAATINQIIDQSDPATISENELSNLLLSIQHGLLSKDRSSALLRLEQLAAQAAEQQKNNQIRVLLAETLFAQGELEKMALTVEQLPYNQPINQRHSSLAKVVSKYRSPEYPDYHSFKIFGIGLSKTATTSLNSALNILGYHSIHWVNPHTNVLFTEDDYLLFDAFTDFVVAHQFESLYERFPNAKFIYTTRPIKSWVESVRNHYQRVAEVSTPDEFRSYQTSTRRLQSDGEIEKALYGVYDSWEAAYQAYDRRVREFFSTKPTECFLELGICEGEGWEKLCPFLGANDPKEPFPKENLSHRNA